MSYIVKRNPSAALPKRLWCILRGLVLWTICGLIFFVGCVSLLLNGMPTGSLAKELVIQAVKTQTGRTLDVNGTSELSWFPSIRLRLNDIALSPASDATGRASLTADSLEVAVKVIDFWKRRYEVTEISLLRPVLTMTAGDSLLVRLAEGEVSAGGIPQKINITDGRIVVLAQTSQQRLRIKGVTGRLVRTEDGKGLTFKGNLEANGETVAFNGKISDLQALGNGDTSPAKLSLANELVTANFTGYAATQPIGQIVGKLTLKSGAFPGLLKWAQIDAAQANPGREAELEGQIASSLRRMTLSKSRLKLDALTGSLAGEFSIEGERPVLNANLETTKLDINALLPRAARPVAFSIAPFDSSAVLPTAWQSLLEELEGTPRTKGAALGAAVKPIGWWSSAPFKLTRLPELETQLNIKADKIVYGNLPLKNGRFVVNSRPQRLEVLVNRMELYDGSIRGRVDLDLTEGPMATGLRLKLNNLHLKPLAAEVRRHRLISGIGDIDISVDGRGGSMRELVGSLNGAMTMDFNEGAILGFDVARAVSSFGSDQAYNPENTTPFTHMRAAFSLRNGVLRSTEPLRLAGPVITVTSNGSIGLVSQRIDQRLTVLLSTPPPHLPIPLRVRGTIDRPDISWDIFSAVASPEKFATPFAVGGSDEKMPAAVRCMIEKKLTTASSNRTLSPASRHFLQVLLNTRGKKLMRNSGASHQAPESCPEAGRHSDTLETESPNVAGWKMAPPIPSPDVLPGHLGTHASLPPLPNLKPSVPPATDQKDSDYITAAAPTALSTTTRRKRRSSAKKNSIPATDWRDKALFQD